MNSSEEYLDSLLRSVTGESDLKNDELSNGMDSQNNMRMPSMTELFNMEQDINSYPADFGAQENYVQEDTQQYAEDAPNIVSDDFQSLLQDVMTDTPQDNVQVNTMPSMAELFSMDLSEATGVKENPEVLNEYSDGNSQIMHNENGEYYFASDIPQEEESSANSFFETQQENVVNDYENSVSSADYDVNNMSMSESGLGDMNMPGSELGDMNMSDLGLGDINMPDLGLADMSMPESELGDMNMSDLGLGDKSMPESGLGDMSMPDLGLGDINMPDLGLADMSMPELELGDMSTPVFEDMSVEDINTEDLLSSEIGLSDTGIADSNISDIPVGDSVMSDMIMNDMDTSDIGGLDFEMPNDLLQEADDTNSVFMDSEDVSQSVATDEFSLSDEMLDDIANDNDIQLPEDIFEDFSANEQQIDTAEESSEYESSTIIPDNIDLENLDDLLSSFGNEEDNHAQGISDNISDSELGDYLSNMEDDGDLSEIGDILNKNDNQEAVDSSSLMNDSDISELDALFGIEDTSDSESQEETKEEKKARKQREKEEKKRAKEEKKLAKKNKKKGLSESVESTEIPIPDDITDIEQLDSLGFMDDALTSDFSDVNDGADEAKESEKTKKTEKRGFFKKVLDALTEEVDEDEVMAEGVDSPKSVFAEEDATDIAKEGAADNEKLLAEMGDEEGGKKGKKKGKKEKKEKKQKEKKPKKEKAPKKEKVKDNTPIFLVPIKKVIIIMICCLSLGALICVISIFIPYSMDMNKAQSAYDNQRYGDAFLSLTGHKLNADEQELYEKTVILYKVDRKYESYENYMKLGMQTEALNALVQGVGTIDEEQANAEAYGISGQFQMLAQKITSALQNTFAVSVDKAREWLALEDSAEYTRQLDNYVNGTGESDEIIENPVIAGEEAEFSDDSSY